MPIIDPSLSHSALNPLSGGLNHDQPPDRALFREYMASRCWRSYIPTLLRDWVTAHANYRPEALAQVKEWIEENRHLFKQRSPDA